MANEWNPNAPNISENFDKVKDITPKPEQKQEVQGTVTAKELREREIRDEELETQLSTPQFQPQMPGIDKNLQKEMSQRKFEETRNNYRENLERKQYLEKRLKQRDMTRDFRRSR